MDNEQKDNLDILIEQTLKEEIDSIEVSDEMIELEWIKLKHRLDENKPKNNSKFKKIAVIFVGTIISLGLLNTVANNESSAWRMPIISNILTFFDDQTSLDRNITLSDDIIREGNKTNAIIGTIEDAEDIIKFNFKQLPYELEQVTMRFLSDNYQTLELSYIKDNIHIMLTQSSTGQERRENINVTLNSDISEILLDGNEYTVIRINEQYTQIIWNSFGIKYSLDMDDDLTNNEIEGIIRSIE